MQQTVDAAVTTAVDVITDARPVESACSAVMAAAAGAVSSGLSYFFPSVEMVMDVTAADADVEVIMAETTAVC